MTDLRQFRRLARPAVIALMIAAGPASAQQISLTLGDGNSLTQTSLGLILVVTVLSLAPGLLVMVTCFPFVVTVLAILRQAIGLQQSPPAMLIISLSLFLTYFVMEPVFTASWNDGIGPYSRGEMELTEAAEKGIAPFRVFMAGRADAETYAELAELRPDLAGTGSKLEPDTPLSLLIPTFLLSEIQRAFQIGFVLFLPFLIIDLVVAAVLMSMGMMMVPPAMVALPIKLAFFVVADGWTLISSALVRSYF